MTNILAGFVCPQSPPRRKLIKLPSVLLNDQGDKVIIGGLLFHPLAFHGLCVRFSLGLGAAWLCSAVLMEE